MKPLVVRIIRFTTLSSGSGKVTLFLVVTAITDEGNLEGELYNVSQINNMNYSQGLCQRLVSSYRF